MDSFKDITTFRVGGPVARLVRAESADSFIEMLADLARKSEKFLIVGGGSNLLSHDDGYDGTVVMPSFTEIHFENETVTADAGASWDAVVEQSVARGLWGIENLSGIPGTVGGAAVANIGAYGAALSDTLVSVDVYDASTSVRRTLTRDECASGYRTTIFKQSPERYAVLAMTLRLSTTPRPNLGYRDLEARFTGVQAPGLVDIRQAVLEIRSRKFPSLREYGTAGSYFLNPIVSATDAVRIQKQYPGMPVFALPEGGVKVPLAWILDHVVHAKGMREGGAFVWEAQPLVIATESGATSRDVRLLAQKIAIEVKNKTGLIIVPEVRVLEK